MSHRYCGYEVIGKSVGTGKNSTATGPRPPRGREALWIERLEERRMLSARSGIVGGNAAARGHHRAAAVAGLYHGTDVLSLARFSAAATSAGGNVFFLGGNPTYYNGYGAFLDTFDVDQSQHYGYGLPQAANLSGATSVDGQALFVGTDGTGQVSQVNIYDTVTGVLGAHSFPFNHLSMAATTVGDRAIFAGGTSYSNSAHPLNDTAEFYDAKMNAWFEMRLPKTLNNTRAFAASAAGRAIFTDGTIADIYDSSTLLWSSQPLPVPVTTTVAVSAGTKAYFSGNDGRSGDPDTLQVYDGVKNQWSTLSFPQTFTADAATAVGSKIIFAGRYTRYNETGYVTDVYDTRTGLWSTTALSEGRDLLAATTSGARAYFGGGRTLSNGGESATVDVFTDATPAPNIDGILTGQAGGAMSVTIRNSGDAPLPSGTMVGVYLSDTTTYRTAGPLLGSIRLKSALAAGASQTVTVRTTLPKNGIPQNAVFLAQVRVRGTFTSIASTGVVVPTLTASVAAAGLLDVPVLPPVPLTTPTIAVGSKILFRSNGNTGGIPNFALDIFDTSTSQWSHLALAHDLGPAVTVVGNKAIFAGGIEYGSAPFPFSTAGTDIVDIYDGVTGQVSTAHLSHPRMGVVATSLGDLAIFAGGYGVRSYYGGGIPSDVVDIYNNATGQWSTSSLPQATGNLTAIVIGQKVLYFQLYSGYGSAPTIYVFDSVTRTWSTTQLPARTTNYNYVQGISAGDHAVFTDGTTAYIYDPSEDRWSTHVLPVAKSSLSLVSSGGVVLFAGGTIYDQQGSHTSTTLDVFNAVTGVWSQTVAPRAGGSMATAVLNGKIIVNTELGSKLPAYVDVFDTAIGVWSTTVLAVGHDYQAGLIVAADQLLIVGSSYNGTKDNADLLRFTSVATPTAPTPVDTSILAVPPTAFSWTASPGADSYDVYLDDALVQNVPGNQWMPGTPIITGTHTWRVVARFGGGLLSGATWQFIVLAPR